MRRVTGRRVQPLRAWALPIFLILATFVGLTPAARAEGTVAFYYFFDPTCATCEQVHREVIEPLVAEFGARVAIDERDIGEVSNFELMIGLEQSLGAGGSDIPEVAIGDRVLAGAEAIHSELRDLVLEHEAQGGVALPAVSAAPTVAPRASDCALCEPTIAAASSGETSPAATLQPAPVVRAILFWSETCPHCHEVITESLPPIQERYGDRLEVLMANISQEPGYALWVAAMEARAIPSNGQVVPMLFVGDEILTGSVQIPEELPGIVDRLLVGGGADLPKDIRAQVAAAEAAAGTPEPTATPALVVGVESPPAIHAAYFYQPGCDVCDRADHDLRYISDKYPQIVIERYDVRADAPLNQYLCERYGVPEDKHLTAPAFFVGDQYLLGDAIRAAEMERLVAPLLATGAPEPWAGWDGEQQVAVESIVERFRSFGTLTVLGAGLLDGVNPCAFATMVFLISYLSLRKRKGAALLATGAAFTLGVFLTYLGVGFGFLRFLGSLPFLSVIARWVYAITAMGCLALAWGSVMDYRKARAGRLEDMSLKLPERLRGWSKKLIREGVSARRFVLSAFLLGLGVSVIELACTGQVYLPTIIFMLGLPEWRTQASALLIAYNVMFVLPLIGVFVLVYLGTTSQQLIDWMTKHTATVKLGTAVLFLLLAGWLVRSVVVL